MSSFLRWFFDYTIRPGNYSEN